MPVPVVDEIWACDHIWVEALKCIWTMAEADPSILARIKEEQSTSVPEAHDSAFTFGVLLLQPPKMRDGLDLYTLEVLKSVCRTASEHPLTLHQLLSGEIDQYTVENVHLELAWCLRKLQMNSQFRLRDSTSSPISQLPVEILRLIFEYIRHAYPRYEKGMGRDIWDVASYLPPRLVCRYWASTIDKTPSLWSPMALVFGDRMTNLALRLSQGECLDITVTEYGRPRFGVGPSIAKILKNLLRIDILRLRTLDLKMDTWDEVEQTIRFLSSSPAPQLESLSILPFVRDEPYRTVTIAPGFFTSAPSQRLHTLSLAGLHVALPNAVFQRTLRRLKLEQCAIWPSLDSMIDTLSALPALEYFMWGMSLNALDNAESSISLSATAFLSTTRSPTSLPYMAELSLECPVEIVSAIMASITIPPSCRVHILDDYSVTGDDQEIGVIERLIEAMRASLGSHLRRSFSAGSGGGYSKIAFDEYPEVSSGRGALWIQAYGPCDTEATPHCSLSFVVAENIPGRLSQNTITSILCEVLKWPAMTNTTSVFKTNHEALADSGLWNTVLQSLPRLRSVHIDNDAECEASASIVGLSRALSLDGHLAINLGRIHLDGLIFPPPVQQYLALACRDRYIAGRMPVALVLIDCKGVNPYTLEQILRTESAGALYLEELRVGRM